MKLTLNKIVKKDGETVIEPQTDHPVLELLDKVNPYLALPDLLKITQIYKDATSYTAAIISYIDAHDAMPGDENNPNVPPGDNINVGDGDGNVEELTDECTNLFEDLVNAGFTTQRPLKNGFPTHVYGGWISANTRMGMNKRGLYLIFYSMPNKTIAALDRKYDDGIWNTGRIWGKTDYGGEDDGLRNFWMTYFVIN